MKYLLASFNMRLPGLFAALNWANLAVSLATYLYSPVFMVCGLVLQASYLLPSIFSKSRRQSIDAKIIDFAREQQRQSMLAVIKDYPSYYRRWIILMSKCDEIVKHCQSRHDVRAVANGLNELSWLFVNLCVSTSKLESFVEGEASNRETLEYRLGTFKAQLKSDNLSEELRGSISGTIQTLKSRLDIHRSATEKLAFTRSELHRIEEEVAWTQEQSLVSGDATTVSGQINAIAAGITATSKWIQEQQDIFGPTVGDERIGVI